MIVEQYSRAQTVMLSPYEIKIPLPNNGLYIVNFLKIANKTRRLHGAEVRQYRSH